MTWFRRTRAPRRRLSAEPLESRVAPAGDLDPLFGTGGLTQFSFASDGFDKFTVIDTAVQPDGKIVVVGTAGKTGATAGGALRLNPDGKTLDGSFGTNGQLTFPVGPSEAPGGVTLDGVGRILISGGGPQSDVGTSFLARLTPTGQPDGSFAPGGVLALPGGPVSFGNGADVGVLSDGSYVVLVDGGSVIREDPNFGGLDSSDYNLRVIRVTPDGMVDAGFKGTIDFFPRAQGVVGQNEQPVALAVGTVGGQEAIWVTGTLRGVGGTRILVGRLTLAGNPDAGFGTAGKAEIDVDISAPGFPFHESVAGDLAADAGGRVVVVGTATGVTAPGVFPNKVIVARLGADGTFDATFKGGGKAAYEFVTGAQDFGRGVGLDSKGRIVVAGVTDPATSSGQPDRDSKYAVLRLVADGTPDPAFANNGVQAFEFPSNAMETRNDRAVTVGFQTLAGVEGVIVSGIAELVTAPTGPPPSGPFGKRVGVARLLSDDAPPPNTPPTISDIPNTMVFAGQSTGPLGFTIDDKETPADMLMLSADSSNPVLISKSAIVLSGFGKNRTVTVNAPPGMAGMATITVTVTDAGGKTAADPFLVTVIVSDTPPTISDIPNKALTAGQSTGPLLFTIRDAETPADKLMLKAVSSNPGLIPDDAVTFGGFGENRTVTVNTLPGMAGIATVTVTVTDSDNRTASDPFVIFVTLPVPGNTPPRISDIPDQTIPRGRSTGPIPFTIGDDETPADMLDLVVVSSDPGLIPPGNVVFGGSGANRTVTVTVPPSAAGRVMLTVTVRDRDPVNPLSAFDSFVVTVPANTPPTISDIAGITIQDGTAVGPIGFTVGDNETPADMLVLSVESSNPGLLPPSAVVLGGSGKNRTVTVNAPPGMTGRATITVTVRDAEGLPASDPFLVEVVTAAAINTPPTISDIPSQFVTSGQSTGPIPFTIGDAETPADQLVVTVTSSDPEAVLSLGGFGPNRTVTVRPGLTRFAAVTVTVTVTDAGRLTARDEFFVFVRTGAIPGNTPPTISAIPSRVVVAGQSTGPIPFTVGDVETPAGELTLRAGFMADVTLINTDPAAGEVVFGGSGANRTVTVNSRPGTTGQVRLTVFVRDAGRLEAEAAFFVQINPTPPPGDSQPTISPIPTQVVTAGLVARATFTVRDEETPPDLLTVTVTSSSNPAVAPLGEIRTTKPGRDGVIEITVPTTAGVAGESTITIIVTDPSGRMVMTTFVVRAVLRPAPAGPMVAVGALSANDPDVRVFDAIGGLVFELSPFEAGVTRTHVAVADFNGDGFNDVVVAAGTGSRRVMIFDGRTKAQLANFFVTFNLITSELSTDGVYVAAGDFNGDGRVDLAVGDGKRDQTLVGTLFRGHTVGVIDGSRLFAGDDGIAVTAISAFESTYQGGVVVAAGDVNGDGKADLIAGAASDGRSRVRVFDGTTLFADDVRTLIPDFYAYSPSCLNGIYVAAGDLDGDRKAEIITGARVGGGPHVRVFGFVGDTFTVIADTMAGDPNSRGGISVDAADMDGDGKAEVLAGTGTGEEPRVLVLTAVGLTPRTGPVEPPPAVSVGTPSGDYGGDRSGSIQTTPSFVTFYVRPFVGKVTLPVTVSPTASLIGADATFQVTAAAGVVVDNIPVRVSEAGAGTSDRTVAVTVGRGEEFELGGRTYELRLSLVYASAGGVTAVQVRIPFDPEQQRRFGPVPDVGPDVDGDGFGDLIPSEERFITAIGPPVVAIDSTAPQLVPPRPLAERTRFAAFDDPFRGGVFVG